MTTNKTSDQHQETMLISAHPLAKIAGRFGGQAWLDTLAEIERFRNAEKQEVNESLNHKSDQ